MSNLARTMAIVCAVGAAMNAGVFFTFSTFAIEGLKRLPPSDGAAAMQSINKEAPTPLFMVLLFGTGAACVVLGIQSAQNLDDSASVYRFIACALFIVGVVLLTIGFHVPRNNELAGLDPNGADGVAYWATYLEEWVRMNHVRTITPLVSAVLLAVSLQMN